MNKKFFNIVKRDYNLMEAMQLCENFISKKEIASF